MVRSGEDVDSNKQSIQTSSFLQWRRDEQERERFHDISEKPDLVFTSLDADFSIAEMYHKQQVKCKEG